MTIAEQLLDAFLLVLVLVNGIAGSEMSWSGCFSK